MKKSNRTLIKILISVCIIVLLSGIITGIYLYRHFYHTEWISSDYEEISEAVNNPYIGWYRLYGYQLSDKSEDLSSKTSRYISENHGNRLILLEINLKNYRDKNISPIGLSQLDTILKDWASTDTSVILRFTYDWDGQALKTEPASTDIIKNHMEQIAAIVNTYPEDIYILQGLFTGNYGEMNNTSYSSVSDLRLLARTLIEKIDNRIFLSVRTPAQWRGIYETDDIAGLIASNVDGDNNNSDNTIRFGLFNDGLLGSDTDLGTYENSSIANEISFQNELCRYVPNGGEAIGGSPLSDIDNAVSYFRSLHISYLNSMYDSNVLGKWKNSVYTGDELFSNKTGYDYITAHLGYRYVLRSSQFEYRTFFPESGKLTIGIENNGFANSCRSFDVSVNIVRADGSSIKIDTDTDTRNWNSSETTMISIPLPFSYTDMGTAKIYLSITDPYTGEVIKLANTGVLSDYGYLVGQLNTSK